MTIHIALCDDDRCHWKHRGVTAEATDRKAHEHAQEAGHGVTVYEDYRPILRIARWSEKRDSA